MHSHFVESREGKETRYKRCMHSCQQVVNVSSIFLGPSVLGSKWSRAWQIGCTSSALGEQLNSSINWYLIIGLFYFNPLQYVVLSMP